MQLNEICEKYTIKEISYQTKISEENLESLFNKDFEVLKRVKTFGFISIVAREYKADLGDLHKEAEEYYRQLGNQKTSIVSGSLAHEKKEKSRILPIFIFLLLGYATWYFLTQFDKKHLGELVPFIDEATVEQFVSTFDEDTSTVEALDITKVEVTTPIETTATLIEARKVAPIKVEAVENNKTVVEEIIVIKDVISIIPVNRLWFGTIELPSKKRDHFSIAKSFDIDVSSENMVDCYFFSFF
ncbi:MAG: hypothetical protein Q9M36_13710 [Sulfurovum sp.]|nr:hypothetical protein [Sulfurovum sp.]